MLDKVKESVKKIDYKIVIILLLIFIIAFQFYQNQKINRLRRFIFMRTYGVEDIFDNRRDDFFFRRRMHDFFDDESHFKKLRERFMRDHDFWFNDDERHIERRREEIRKNLKHEKPNAEKKLPPKIFNDEKPMPKKDFPHHNRNRNKINVMNDFSFSIQEKYDKENNQFIATINVPMNLDKKDIMVDFKDNIMTVSFSKLNEKKDENSTMESYYNFSRSFSVPETKATLKDVKQVLNKGVLTLTVPIIK